VRAVVFDAPGAADVLRVRELADPRPGPGELLLDVRAAGVNRADLLQRRGLYPPPPGAPDILGLEAAGEVLAVGEGVAGWRPGDRAMALLQGGGYATRVAAPAACCLPVPENLSLVEAAALPEALATVELAVFRLGELAPGELLLLHGGSGGVGTLAIQMAVAAGATVIATAGGPDRARRIEALGAARGVDHRHEDFAAAVAEASGGRGADVILDCVGAPYLPRHLRCLATGGRLVLIGLMGGRRAEIDLAPLLARRLRVIGTTLRARPLEERAAVVAAVRERWLPAVREGRVRPVIAATLPLERAAEAHRRLERGDRFGKIVLVP